MPYLRTALYILAMAEVTLENTLIGHQNPIYTLAIDEQNGLLYSAGNDKGIVEWDMKTLKFSRVLCTVPSSVYNLCFIAEMGLLLATLRTGGILVIGTNGPKLAAKLTMGKGACFIAKPILSKNELVAVDENGKAYVWSLNNYELLYSFQLSSTTVRSIVIDEKTRTLVAGDKNGDIFLLDIDDFHLKAKASVHAQSVTSIAMVDGNIISGGRDAKIYKLAISDLETLLDITPHMFTVYGIIPLKIADLFVTISRDKTIKLWDSSFKLHKNISRDRGIDSHHLSINAGAFSSTHNLLFTAGDDKAIKAWKITV